MGTECRREKETVNQLRHGNNLDEIIDKFALIIQSGEKFPLETAHFKITRFICTIHIRNSHSMLSGIKVEA